MKTKSNLFIFCTVIVLATLGTIVLSVVNTPSEIQPLTQSQTDAMIKLGVIQVDPNLVHESSSSNTELVYQTNLGECSVYQDIFGRYYCKW